MKFICVLLFLMSSTVYADSCMNESKQFFDLVAVKWGVNSSIEKSPNDYKKEKWEYILSLGNEAFKKGKFDKKTSIAVSKVIAENNFSDNPEVEVNIFEDYWLLSCRRTKIGKESKELSKIPKERLLACWNSASSRKDFQNCIDPLLSSKL